MRRGLVWLALFAALACFTFSAAAQESSPPEKDSSAGSPGDENLGLKWFNFAVLAAGLGYLAAKQGPAFFNARTSAIQQAIKDATGLKMDADFRASEIDRKMATLGAEISRLRAEAAAEMQDEQQRLAKETRQALGRIDQHVAQELVSLEHNARMALRRHTVDLAVSMASSRLRDQLGAGDHDALVSAFASQLFARQPGGLH